MAAPNVFQEIKTVLTDIKTFLDQNVAVIKPAINALAAIVPQIKDAINELIRLMGSLKQAINSLNAQIPGLAQVTETIGKSKTLLDAMRGLLPNETGKIDDLKAVLDVVISLPSVDQIKAEIIGLIDAVVVHLNSLKG